MLCAFGGVSARELPPGRRHGRREDGECGRVRREFGLRRRRRSSVLLQRRRSHLRPGLPHRLLQRRRTVQPTAPRCLKAKFHYTGPTGPARTRTDFFARPRPQTRVFDKVRRLCLVGSGRARVVEFSYYVCSRGVYNTLYPPVKCLCQLQSFLTT